MKSRIRNVLNYKKPAFWVIAAAIIAVIALVLVLISNPVKGFSIYQHPETFLSQNSLRVPTKVSIIDHMSGDQFMLTEPNEITQVTAIVEDMRIAKKEISKSRSEMIDNRYSIAYYDDINDSISEYRYTIHVAPVWIDNNVKPSYRFKLINQKDITKRLEAVFARKGGKAAYNVDSLLKNKTPYIGDNSKVVALIDALPLPMGVNRGTVELATSEVPYGVTIYYNLEDDSLQVSEEQFLRNSILLFALIDNADEVKHIGFWKNKLLSSTPFSFTYTRADAERIVGGDVRQFAENQESLAELIEVVQMIGADHSKTVNAEKIQMTKTWAEALKRRDGKLRYEIMSESMKGKFVTEQKQRSGEEWNYNIGFSSPWVVNYDIDVQGDTATIIYHLADSSDGKYDQTEVITFGKENNQLVVIDVKVQISPWERVSYFAPTAKQAREVYTKALLERDYLTLLSLAHAEPFDPKGQENWDTIKINSVKVVGEDVRKNKACFELELDIKDGGNSAFERGVFPRWLWLVKGEQGWFVEGLMTGGAPDANWWLE